MAQQVRDLALSLLWHGFLPWPGTFHMPQAQHHPPPQIIIQRWKPMLRPRLGRSTECPSRRQREVAVGQRLSCVSSGHCLVSVGFYLQKDEAWVWLLSCLGPWDNLTNFLKTSCRGAICVGQEGVFVISARN